MLAQFFPDTLLSLVDMEDVKMLSPVNVFQKIQDGWNIFMNQEGESNSGWNKIAMFVSDQLLLMSTHVRQRSDPDPGVGVVTKHLCVLPAPDPGPQQVRGNTPKY